MPALLNAQSRRPNSATVRATSAWTSCSLATLHAMNAAWRPVWPIIAAVSSQEAALTSDTMTLAPSRANANADARPMPLPAPVTRATLPSNSEVDISFSS